MNTRLFDINYQEILNKNSLNELEITCILDNFLRFDYLLRTRLSETLPDETKSGYKEGVNSIQIAEEFLLKLMNNETEINEDRELFKNIIALHLGFREIFEGEVINEEDFTSWLSKRASC